jgi:hypothetical protein
MGDHVAFVGKHGHVIVSAEGYEMKCGAPSWSRLLSANFDEVRQVLSWRDLAAYFLAALFLDAASFMVGMVTEPSGPNHPRYEAVKTMPPLPTHVSDGAPPPIIPDSKLASVVSPSAGATMARPLT